MDATTALIRHGAECDLRAADCWVCGAPTPEEAERRAITVLGKRTATPPPESPRDAARECGWAGCILEAGHLCGHDVPATPGGCGCRVPGFKYAYYIAHYPPDLHARLASLEAENAALDKALQSLTPGGSEFVNDPTACVAYVRKARESQHETILRFKARLTAAEQEAAALREALEKIVADHVERYPGVDGSQCEACQIARAALSRPGAAKKEGE